MGTSCTFVKLYRKMTHRNKIIEVSLKKIVIFFEQQKQPPEVFCKKGVLRNFVKFTGKHLRQSLRLQPCNFIKKETLAQVLSCEFYKISKSTFFTEHLWWLLLEQLDVTVETNLHITQIGFLGICNNRHQ